MREIDVAKEFSARPAGRYHPKDGDATGQRFREQFLIDFWKRKPEKIVVNLDGLRFLTSSFLEEVFGGLVRQGYSKEFLDENLEVKLSGDRGPIYLGEIKEIIDAALKHKVAEKDRIA
jgi:uncharacterized protein DUF4325